MATLLSDPLATPVPQVYQKLHNLKVVISSLMGNAFEYYDFMLCVYLTTTIGPLFYPSDNEVVSILGAFATYAVGFVMRPLGGIFFGHMGDLYGRKKALVISISMMALPTFLMGCLPTYADIGIWAPIGLVVCRMMQGFSTGGELNGAGIFTVENVTRGWAGFSGGIISSSSAIGGLAASAVALFVTMDGMPAWGWRIAFWIGSVLGFVGLYVRIRMGENFQTPPTAKVRGRMPLLEVFRDNKRSMICNIFIAAFSGIMYNFTLVYLGVYLEKFRGWAHTDAMLLMVLAMICYITSAPLMGALGDRIGPQKVIRFGAAATVLLGFPLAYFVSHTDGFWTVFAGVIVLVLMETAFQGPLNLFMSRLFPRQNRYSGMAFSYCVGIAAFGGTASMVFMGLASNWGSIWPPIYLVFGAIMGLIAVALARPTYQIVEDK